MTQEVETYRKHRTEASTPENASESDYMCGSRITSSRLCGYELIRNLDFADAAHYADGTVNDGWRPNNANPDTATNAGFPGFGAPTGSSDGFTAIFEGNDYVINNFYSRADPPDLGMRNVGLFRSLASAGIIRNVGLTNANVYGGGESNDRVGGLVGDNTGGTITASYVTGSVNGGGDNDDYVGGLVGNNNGGTITASHATASVHGGDETTDEEDRVGGLVGNNDAGRIIASYATGNTDGGSGNMDRIGGLVGNNANGTIIASYARGNANGGGGDRDLVGGLVGYNTGLITASYASGKADGGIRNQDSVGGLVGENLGGTITASYASGNADGGDENGDGSSDDNVGGLVGNYRSGTITESYAFGSRLDGAFTDSRGTPPSGVTSAQGLTAANAGASWNNPSEGTAGAWNFGTTSEYPALVYADYDGVGTRYSCDNYPEEIPGTVTSGNAVSLVCGNSNASLNSLVGNYRYTP